MGDTTVFTSPVQVNGEDADLRFTFNSKTREFSLQGFVPIEEDDTQGRLQDINAGDVITILSERFVNNDGDDTEFIETASITADNSLELSTINLPDGSYQIYAVITDIYGDEFLTNFFDIKLEGGKVVEATVK